MEIVIFKVLLFFSFFLPFAINFILWPSRRNVIFIKKFPFFVLAYAGGVLFLFDETVREQSISENNILRLCFVMLLGSFVYVFSFYLAFRSKIKLKSYLRVIVERYIIIFNKFYYKYSKKLHIIVILLSVVAIIFYLYSYARMGFIPMFTKNILAAKFFAGEYQEKYRPVAPFFRSALNISTIIIPFLLIFLFSSRRNVEKFLYGLFFLAIVTLTFFSLRRGIVAYPIIDTMLLFFAYYKKGRYILLFSLVYIIVFTFGASLNTILLFFLGLKAKIDLINIVRGVPDVADLLRFWDDFIKVNYEFSLGRTIYGGLIPYHYDWNPAVVTKLVVGAGKNVATGGYRLPFQVEGYIAFGYIGTFIWSVYYGFINGLYLRLVKYFISIIEDNFLVLYMSIFVVNIAFSLMNFALKMQIDKLEQMFISIFILFFLRINFNLIRKEYVTENC